ncbi:MAG TPA: hypothetical protein PKC91_09280 [Ignavibacteria bacterium]|nr:hypothetical protein [Ignavibacteria bacterium]
MKNILILFLILLINSFIKSQPQPNMGEFEILIENFANNSNYDVYVRVSPVGAVFNNDQTNIPIGSNGKYSMLTTYMLPQVAAPPLYGGISPNLNNANEALRKVWIQHIVTGFPNDPSRPNKMAIGWGKYKVEFGNFENNIWIPLNGNPHCYLFCIGYFR